MTESSYHSSSHIEGSSQNEDVSHGSADDSLFNYSTKESQRVKRSKATVLTVILALASLAGSLTYLVAWQQEKKTYIRVYRDIVKEANGLLDDKTIAKKKQMTSFSITLTSYLVSTGATWPTVAIPDFVRRGELSRGVSGAVEVALVPLVKSEDRETWENFVIDNQDQVNGVVNASAHIYANVDENPVVQETRDLYAPLWQTSPELQGTSNRYNLDFFSLRVFKGAFEEMKEKKTVVLARDEVHKQDEWFLGLKPIYPYMHDEADPSTFNVDDAVGVLVSFFRWEELFTDILHPGVEGVHLVLYDSCGDHLTFLIVGQEASFLGQGDLHDPKYDDLAQSTPLKLHFMELIQKNGECHYDIGIYPTQSFEDSYHTMLPLIYAMALVVCFIVTASVFIMYDFIVSRRHAKLMASAGYTNRVLSSMFPKSMRDRILNDAMAHASPTKLKKENDKELTTSVLSDGYDSEGGSAIAEFYPMVTVMFADIVGFTAWSSAREPSQVFKLLESVFSAFDTIVHKKRVFKVETVGDCFLAVAGIPQARPDHAVVMARVADSCVKQFNAIVKQLEISLGPETGDLAIRIGLHSGPVTAGVIRGERARFQLFGDTMNTASRIESSGAAHRIHCSAETAEFLEQAGKGHWLTSRPEPILAKGKGKMDTFWISTNVGQTDASSRGTSSGDHTESTSSEQHPSLVLDEKQERLVNWNVETLLRALAEIMASKDHHVVADAEVCSKLDELETKYPEYGKLVLDEVVEVVELSRGNKGSLRGPAKLSSIDEKVVQQVKKFVRTVATLYRKNEFHNFEHASHVTMSTLKLFGRIRNDHGANENQHEDYGITDDPLIRFSCLFATLIHDVDHMGVPNARLVQEAPALAKAYESRSVAEQNSVDMAWTLLLCEDYREFRRCIYTNQEEFLRFRQLTVNAVMATDIADKDLKKVRNGKWDVAFSEGVSDSSDLMDRKATIVIEHLIQASDVSHTMQHWHIFRKWNERLFDEMYQAYLEGRASKNPADTWYKGELGFFDFYIIPLAQKLKTCDVFGVSGDEYMTYAKNNRKEWELKGKEIVSSYLQKY